MKIKLILSSILVIAISSCSSDYVAKDKSAMVGADKDEYGCIASAGYQWCERTNQCERPWELAQKKGVENTAEEFILSCKKE